MLEKVINSSLNNNQSETVENLLIMSNHDPEVLIDILETFFKLVLKNKELANSGRSVLRYLVSLASKRLDQEELCLAVLKHAKECSVGESVYSSISTAYENSENRDNLLLDVYNKSGAIRSAVLSLIVARLTLKYRQSEGLT